MEEVALEFYEWSHRLQSLTARYFETKLHLAWVNWSQFVTSAVPYSELSNPEYFLYLLRLENQPS